MDDLAVAHDAGAADDLIVEIEMQGAILADDELLASRKLLRQIRG